MSERLRHERHATPPSWPTRNLPACALILFLLAALPAVAAGQGCWLALPKVTDGSITIDGARTGAEWNTAGTAASSDGCLEHVPDYSRVGVTNTYPMRNAYVSAVRDNNNLYFLVEVEDMTTNLIGNTLSERVMLHIDPGDRRGTSLSAVSPFAYRLEIRHRWQADAAGPPRIAVDAAGSMFQTSTTAPNAGCVAQQWTKVTPMPATIVTAIAATPMIRPGGTSGYTVEVQVPLSLVQVTPPPPNVVGNIGLAVGIVNDLNDATHATNVGTGVNNEYGGAAWPSSLHFASNANGVLNPGTESYPIGCTPTTASDWLKPVRWGHGYMGPGPSDVTISRLPVAWNSDGIELHQCYIDASNNAAYQTGYDYYPSGPCKITVRAELKNSDQTGSAVRNVLYVWANRDAGSAKWTFMDLQKGQVVPAATGPMTPGTFWVPSVAWAPAAHGLTGLAEHPCMRVYALPSSFIAPYDENWMRGISALTDADLNAFLNAYGIVDANWAQKNINRNPDLTKKCTGVCLTLQDLMESGPGRYFASLSFSTIANALSPRPLLAQEKDPTAGQIFLSRRDMVRFARSDAVVQVQTRGFVTKGPYRFIQDVGGAIELLPAERALVAGKPVALKFNITNGSSAEMRILPQVTTSAAPSLQGFRVATVNEPFTLAPGRTLVFNANAGTGDVPLPPGPTTPPGTTPPPLKDCFGRARPATGAGLVGAIIFIGFLVRRRREDGD